MWTRIALYATLGTLLDAMGHDVTSWGFWCVVGLFFALEHLTRMDTINEIEQEVARLRAQRNKDKQ